MWYGGMGRGGLDDDDRGQIYNHEVIKRLFPYFKSRMGLFTLSMVMMLVYTSTLVLIPWLIGYTIDNYVLSRDMSGLNRIGLVLIGVITANLGWQLPVHATSGQDKPGGPLQAAHRHVQPPPEALGSLLR